jgi:hypothetical protein
MRNAIAARHGTKHLAVGGITPRARNKAHKRGSRGKNNRKANTGSDVSSDDDSNTETVYSYSLQPGDGNGGLPGEDASVSSTKMSNYPSSLDVDGGNNTSLYGEDVSTPKLSAHEKSLDLDADTDPSLYGDNVVRTNTTSSATPIEYVSSLLVTTPKPPDNKMAVAAPVESVSNNLDADTDPSLYGANDVPPPKLPDNKTSVATPIEYVSSFLVTTPKSPDSKTAVASPVENLSLSIDVDVDTDPSLYGTKDMPTPNLSYNGQKHILIEAEIDSVASHDESTPRVVTQTQALPSVDADDDVTLTEAAPPADADKDVIEALPSADADDDVTQTQAVPPADADEDAIIVPNPPSKLPPRDYTSFYVKEYHTNKGAQYWSDEITDSVFSEPQDMNFKPPYANWKGKFKNMLKYGEDFGKYHKFFKSKAPETTYENLVTAKIGTSAVTIKDLKSLAPGTWLNDTIIDHTTDLLASICAEYSAKKKTDVKVAVFDSRFTALIIEHPLNSDPPCYNYSRVRGYGDRQLRQRSTFPLDVIFNFKAYFV